MDLQVRCPRCASLATREQSACARCGCALEATGRGEQVHASTLPFRAPSLPGYDTEATPTAVDPRARLVQTSEAEDEASATLRMQRPPVAPRPALDASRPLLLSETLPGPVPTAESMASDWPPEPTPDADPGRTRARRPLGLWLLWVAAIVATLAAVAVFLWR